MKVSIVTVCLDRADTIEGTVRSVLEQEYGDIEHIVVDGGSRDATLRALDDYRTRLTIVSEPDNGMYDAMNKGLAMASGEIVGFLHADDVYADERVVGDVVGAVQAAKAEAVYADLVYVDRSRPDRVRRKWVAGEYRDGDFEKGWMPPHPTFFARRSVYERYGAYDCRLSSSADYELMLRFIHRHRVRLAYLPRVIAKMRVGGISNAMLSNRIRAHLEDRRAWQINGLKPRPLTLLRKPLGKLPQFFDSE